MLPVVLATFVSLTYGASYSQLLNDLSQLYQLKQPATGGRYGYYDDELVGRSMPDGWNIDDSLFSRASIRDPEYIEQYPSLWGFQSVSGGTGDGKEHPKEVKTDKVLPAYCNPPNPCPVGYTADDNCVENFENSLENNRRLLKQQDCPCDAEHMWSCPDNNHESKEAERDYGNWMEQLGKSNTEDMEDNFTLRKREKKAGSSNRLKRSTEEILAMMNWEDNQSNPYFEGPHKSVQAKKGDPAVDKIPHA